MGLFLRCSDSTDQGAGWHGEASRRERQCRLVDTAPVFFLHPCTVPLPDLPFHGGADASTALLDGLHDPVLRRAPGIRVVREIRLHEVAKQTTQLVNHHGVQGVVQGKRCPLCIRGQGHIRLYQVDRMPQVGGVHAGAIVVRQGCIEILLRLGLHGGRQQLSALPCPGHEPRGRSRRIRVSRVDDVSGIQIGHQILLVVSAVSTSTLSTS